MLVMVNYAKNYASTIYQLLLYAIGASLPDTQLMEDTSGSHY